jgi:hypothetical protein
MAWFIVCEMNINGGEIISMDLSDVVLVPRNEKIKDEKERVSLKVLFQNQCSWSCVLQNPNGSHESGVNLLSTVLDEIPL